MKKIVEGERLFLATLDINHIDDSIMAWFKDESLMKYYTNSKQPITKEKLISAIEEGEESGQSYTYGIYYKDNNACIGTIKLGPINIAHKISDLVVLLGDKNYHGKGLAIEAIKLGNKVAFEKHDLRKLYGGMYENNVASIKAYTRAGWKEEGRLKGHYFENGRPLDRVLVGCFNPKYFSDESI